MNKNNSKREDFLKLIQEKHQEQEHYPKKKKRKINILIVLLHLVIYITIIGIGYLFLDNFGYEIKKKDTLQNIEKAVNENQTNKELEKDVKNVVDGTTLTNGVEPTKSEVIASKADIELLKVMVLQNAINYYERVNSRYPKELQELLGYYPNNYLSYIPNDMSYHYKLGNYYKVKSKTYEYLSCDETCKQTGVELHVYEKTNQLAVVRTDTQDILALYSVATGVRSLPFKETKVLKRVQNPNLTNEALGTRGLELQDNYAIHGTNEPASIGEKVSDGCIRMNNEDIETLYPYISLGTPVKIKEGKPEKEPIFKDGLPTLEESLIKSPNETSPNEVFNWKW